MGITEILGMVGQYGLWTLPIVALVSLGRTRPARTAGWMLSVNLWDRFLRRHGVPDEERRELIRSAARRDLDRADPMQRIPTQAPRDQEASTPIEGGDDGSEDPGGRGEPSRLVPRG